MASKSNRAVYGILLLVFILFVVLIVFATFTLNFLKQNDSLGSSISMSREKASIAVIDLEGVIMEGRKTIELLHEAEKDKTVKAIILRINSPGGAVGPTQEIYEEIRRIDQAYTEGKTNGKPVYASFGTIAASGGYYIGAACRKIFSSPGTLTGSIGVIMQFFDLSKLYEFVKVNPNTIKSGKYKDIGQPSRPMTPEEQDLMANLITGVHKQFINDILALRKTKLKQDIWELAQGQVFSGEQALSYGLVDHIGGLWSAGRQIHEELKLAGEFGLRFLKPKKKMELWEILENIEQSFSNLNWKGAAFETPVLMFKP